jgi:hypothetical protein
LDFGLSCLSTARDHGSRVLPVCHVVSIGILDFFVNFEKFLTSETD